MSFLDRIRGALNQEQEPTELELSLEELISRIDEKTSKQDKDLTEKAYSIIEDIHSNLSDLSNIIGILEKVEPESGLPGPKAVKDRFCVTARQQLASVETPAKEINEIREFLNKTHTLINNLGNLTQRQLMHIQFFFKQDFIPVSKKMKQINSKINEARNILRSRLEVAKIKELYKKVKELDRSIIEKGSKSAVIKKGIERLEKDIEDTKKNISKLDTSDYEKTSQATASLENKRSIIEQKITSFLSVEKLLKKLVHEQGGSALINLYIESPVKALLEDKELAITKFVRQALELQEKGGIEVDEKKIEKANKIINTDYLKTNRKNLLEVLEELEKKKEYMENTAKPKMEKKKRLEQELSKLETDMDKLKNNLEKLPEEIKNLERKKSSLEQNIAQEASQVMKTIIRIRS